MFPSTCSVWAADHSLPLYRHSKPMSKTFLKELQASSPLLPLSFLLPRLTYPMVLHTLSIRERSKAWTASPSGTVMPLWRCQFIISDSSVSGWLLNMLRNASPTDKRFKPYSLTSFLATGKHKTWSLFDVTHPSVSLTFRFWLMAPRASLSSHSSKGCKVVSSTSGCDFRIWLMNQLGFFFFLSF